MHKYPLKERFLTIRGGVSPRAMNAIGNGFPPIEDDPGTVVDLFLGFSYAHIPLGSRFEVIFHRDRPSEHYSVDCTLVAVTQEMGKPFNGIPEGWQTICRLRFVGEVPEPLVRMVKIDSWSQGRSRWGICTAEVYRGIMGEVQ